MKLQDVKPGTILVSNSQCGPSFVQVTDLVETQFGTHLDCVRLGSTGKFDTVHNVGDVDMPGIGWKLLTAGDFNRMNDYIS